MIHGKLIIKSFHKIPKIHKLNVNTVAMIKNVKLSELNINIVTVFLNTQTLKMI